MRILILGLIGLLSILSGCGVVKGIATQTCSVQEPNKLLCPNLLERLAEAPPATTPTATTISSSCKKVTSFALRGRGRGVMTRSEGPCAKERKLMQWKARRAGPGVKCVWRKGRVKCASALPMALMLMMGWVRRAGLVMGGLLSTFLMVFVDFVGLVALITRRGRGEDVTPIIEEWVDMAKKRGERLVEELAALEERLDRLYVCWEDVKRPSSLEFDLYQLRILRIAEEAVGVLEEMGYEMDCEMESRVYSWVDSYDWEPISIWEALQGEVGSGYAEARKETKRILEREVRAERALPQVWDDTTIV